MITAPAQELTGTHQSHRTLFVVVLVALAVAVTAIVLLATTPWSSGSSSAPPPVSKASHSQVVTDQCQALPVIHPRAC
jgi:hypothetical protein